VITFFGEAIRHKLEAGLLKEFAAFRSGTLIYETLVDGQRVGLAPGYIGAPGAACQLEELIAMGCEKFIVCGGGRGAA
jgi:uridine phosphorylase